MGEGRIASIDDLMRQWLRAEMQAKESFAQYLQASLAQAVDGLSARTADEPMPARPEYMTRGEAARYLKLGTSKMGKYFVIGNGPVGIKVGRSIRYRKSDLDAWMRARLRRHSADSGEGV